MGPKSKEHTLVKNDGQVFTPDYIVCNILDFCGYKDSVIVGKHVIDNSCGDGAFLREVLHRYIQECLKLGMSIPDIKSHIEQYIHGIDLDPVAYSACLVNMTSIAKEYGIDNVNWDIHNESSLQASRHNGKMDFVVGNPPYVRVHNLNDSYDEVKSYSFANGGMTDLYLVFFELGFNMMADNGVLCYITPSSWLSSVAGGVMRQYIRRHKTLDSVIDLGHYQPFNATAYTMISFFRKQKRSSDFKYYTYDGENRSNIYVDTLSIEESDIANNFYLADKATLSTLRSIKTSYLTKFASVKNGFATLADKVFIGNVPKSAITIKTIKASTGNWYDCLYPYNEKGKPLPIDEVFADPAVKEYFESHKDELIKGDDSKKDWMYFGRTQALNDVQKDKYAINTIIKDTSSIKLNIVPKGSGVYSGLYIVTNVPYEMIKEILFSEDFIAYISALKNYKSGGYYTFNTKDLEQYINYKLTQAGYEETTCEYSSLERGLFEGDLQLF